MNEIQGSDTAPVGSLTHRVGRGFLLGLGILLAIAALAILLNAALFHIFDNAQQWQEWRTEHYWLLLTWRLLLYTALTVAWLKLKARLPKPERLKSQKRLLKIELLVVVLILLVELSKFLLLRGGAL